MKPVTVSIEVPQSPERVFEYIDVLGNHEQFTDHFLLDWQLSGPASGVGAKARMRVKSLGPDDWLDMEVLEAEPPRTTTEESVSANGKRRTRGTYVLDQLPGGGTRINFELAWLEAPFRERLAAWLTRAVVGRANAKSLQRLAQMLAVNEQEEQR
jgi:Polyketide cyclase / dehydrase and lipid transport